MHHLHRQYIIKNNIKDLNAEKAKKFYFNCFFFFLSILLGQERTNLWMDLCVRVF